MDQVRSAIPRGVIAFQPSSKILVREPIYFRTTVPNRFSTVIVVLDIPIEIDMTATYTWNFGDGGALTTKDPGSHYPLSTIRHSYQRAGEYDLTLGITWSGVWRSGALSGPIRGTINQSLSSVMRIESARVRITE